MRIKLTSVFVDDQEKALKFYTEILGFVKKTELPTGDFKWLTVVADGRDGLELLLEPNANPPAREYQKAIHAAGIPSAEGGTLHGPHAKNHWVFSWEPQSSWACESYAVTTTESFGSSGKTSRNRATRNLSVPVA